MPITRLGYAADAIRSDGPRFAPRLPPSRLRELDATASAFNHMVEGLVDRELMRGTFGKFVPESVADQVLTDRGVLAPQTRITTTLFTGIVGFSTVSERMSPEELIGMLDEYFAALVDPIERHGGVIHQFQGDAVLATYNLPVADPDHAAHAVASALEIQRLVGERYFAGGVQLPTRIGINTGVAVCGPVGARGRLGFTVHGDEVNLAARIEQMNKELGTRVLVAQSTVDLCGEAFDFAPVGEVAVRGRQQTVSLYRVEGPHTGEERVTV